MSFATGTLYYLPITITNSQSTATPTNFQQQITIDSATYSTYLASNLSNVNFQDGAGNILNSWLESGNSNSATASVYWVKIPSAIPATSAITIYLAFYSTATNNFNTSNTGEAPTLSGTYGQYDNGSNVFAYYTNFSGTSLPANWTSYSSSGSVTVSNGVLIKGGTSASPGENGIAYQASSGIGAPSYVVDFGNQQSASPSGDSWAWSMSGLSTQLGSYDAYPAGGNHLLINFEGGNYATPNSSYGGTLVDGTLSTPSGNIFNGVFTQLFTASAYYTYYNYTNSSGYGTGTTLGTASLPFEILVGNNEASYVSGGMTVNWFRTRAYPPNATMPSSSFGSVTPVPTTAKHKIILISLNWKPEHFIFA